MRFLGVLMGILIGHEAFAQTAGAPNEGSRLALEVSTGAYEYSWWGKSGRTYFIQQTDNLLTSWNYLPIIESGTNDVLQWGFTSTNDKLFLRLRYTDIPTADPFNADFDGDKVGNHAELLNGTDPLQSFDTDLDGLPDDWEIANDLNLNDPADAGLDFDLDGFTNLQEYNSGTGSNDHFNGGTPPTPTLQAQAFSPTSVHLTWSAGATYGITHFVIERKTEPEGPWYEMEHLDATRTSYSDEYVWQQDTYSYRISAARENSGASYSQFSGASQSSGASYSNTVTVTMPPDRDYDDLSDDDEIALGTDPDSYDSDADGMADGWEVANNLDPTIDDSAGDDDGDGVNNIAEHNGGSNPHSGDSDGDGVSDAREIALGMSPSSKDADGDGIQDDREAVLMVEVVSVSGEKYGFDTYQTTTPPKRYLREFTQWTNLIGGNPESGPIGIGPGNITRNIDPLTGNVTSQRTGVGTGYYPTSATSPTTAADTFDIYSYNDPPNSRDDVPGTVNANATLSIEHTTAMLKQNTVNRMPAFLNSLTNQYYGFVQKYLSQDELTYYVEKAQYKFQFGGNIVSITLNWNEIWVPEDNPDTTADESKAIEVTQKTWTGGGYETATFTIDTHARKPNANGHFLIIPPASPRSSNVYMFSGHPNDLVTCEVPAPYYLDLEWRIPNDQHGVFPNSAALTKSYGPYATFRAGFDGPPIDIPGHEWTQTPGTLKMELYAGTRKLSEWDIEILEIHPRSEWGAAPPILGKMQGMQSVLGATFHHSNKSNDGPAAIKAIQEKHQGTTPALGGRNFADIGYHFAQAKSGAVYEARQLEELGLPQGPFTKGEHVAANNTNAGVGIVLLGDYHAADGGGDGFTAARQLNLEKALTAICRRYDLTSESVSYHQGRAVTGHPTECPGDQVVAKAPAVIENVKKDLE